MARYISDTNNSSSRSYGSSKPLRRWKISSVKSSIFGRRHIGSKEYMKIPDIKLDVNLVPGLENLIGRNDKGRFIKATQVRLGRLNDNSGVRVRVVHSPDEIEVTSFSKSEGFLFAQSDDKFNLLMDRVAVGDSMRIAMRESGYDLNASDSTNEKQ